MQATGQPSAYEQTVLTIMRRLPPERVLQLVDFARFLEFLSVSRPLRPVGLCAGEFIVPSDFDDPLPEYILQEFGGQ